MHFFMKVGSEAIPTRSLGGKRQFKKRMLLCNEGDRILWFELKGCRLKLWVAPNRNKEIGVCLSIVSFHTYNKKGNGRLWTLGMILTGNIATMLLQKNKSSLWWLKIEPGGRVCVCRGTAWAVCDESRMHGSEGGKVWNDLPIPIGSATKWNKHA